MPGKIKKYDTLISRQNIFFYDQIARDYDTFLNKDNYNITLRKKVSEKFLNIVKPDWVLDFGGGTGLDLEWLANNHFKIIFCEPSVAMRQQAIRVNENIIQQHEIIFLEGIKTDFKTWQNDLPFFQKVEAVLANFAVINCIPDLDLLFQNLSLVIKPGGHIIALGLNETFLNTKISGFRRLVRSLLLKDSYSFHVKYNQSEQTVFFHSIRRIKKASAGFYNFQSQESFKKFGFTLIHLIRR